MDPSDIKLSSMEKIFEYEKQAREIDACEDVELLRNTLKIAIKLQMQQQEVISSLGSV
jgi:hypothetical protein